MIRVVLKGEVWVGGEELCSPVVQPEEDEDADGEKADGKVNVKVLAHDWDEVHRSHHLGELGDEAGGPTMALDEGEVVVAQGEGKTTHIGSKKEE